jgi:hypothetical protein
MGQGSGRLVVVLDGDGQSELLESAEVVAGQALMMEPVEMFGQWAQQLFDLLIARRDVGVELIDMGRRGQAAALLQGVITRR